MQMNYFRSSFRSKDLAITVPPPVESVENEQVRTTEFRPVRAFAHDDEFNFASTEQQEAANKVCLLKKQQLLSLLQLPKLSIARIKIPCTKNKKKSLKKQPTSTSVNRWRTSKSVDKLDLIITKKYFQFVLLKRVESQAKLPNFSDLETAELSSTKYIEKKTAQMRFKIYTNKRSSGNQS